MYVVLRNQTRHALGRTESFLASPGTGGAWVWLARPAPLEHPLGSRLGPGPGAQTGTPFGSVQFCAALCSLSGASLLLLLGEVAGPLRFPLLSFFKPAGCRAAVRVWEDSLLEWLEGVLRQEHWEFLC